MILRLRADFTVCTGVRSFTLTHLGRLPVALLYSSVSSSVSARLTVVVEKITGAPAAQVRPPHLERPPRTTKAGAPAARWAALAPDRATSVHPCARL